MRNWSGGRQEGRRWFTDAYYTRNPTITVIDAAPEDEEKRKNRDGQRVPFGFSRDLPRPPIEPLLWEGD